MIRVEPADPGSVRIVFADEGVGMNEQQLETYFQPFHGGFRDGTGLGAAIVYRIVQEHGGTVTVRSAAGQGTEVVLILPVEASAVVQAAGQAAPAGDHALAR
jgi:signal transduction histidine kinase